MTRLLVLGMLDLQPMSGYEIQQMLRLYDAERWGGLLIGSIYHALKKMEAEGHIEIASVESTGHRQKAVYQVTDRGREYIRELVREALTESTVHYPSSLYAGLTFSHKLPDGESRIALEAQRDRLEEEYRALGRGLEAKSTAMDNDIPPMTMLVFENMFAMIRLQQDFITKALKLIGK